MSHQPSARAARPWVLALALVCALGCGLALAALLRPERRSELQPAPEPAGLPGLPLGDGRTVGSAVTIGALTVFPVYSSEAPELGAFTTLEAAVQAGKAEVRELQGGAKVNTVVVDNRGDASILVLAGTVIKGGNQDRQIGEDVVALPHQVLDVSAFCVEHARWNGTRDGSTTGGKFTPQKSLALGSVRAAGQYEGDQGRVWEKVSEVNSKNKKATPSGTLLATMDDAALGAEGHGITVAATQGLAGSPQAARVVGLAYAIGGEVRGIRWFASPSLFALYRDALLSAAAMEALSARDGPPRGPFATQADVAAFVKAMGREPTIERKEGDGQSSEKQRGHDGYASEVKVRPKGSAKVGAPSSTALTRDFWKRPAKDRPGAKPASTGPAR